MMRIASIAHNTFRESIRERMLSIALLFGFILMVSTYALSPLAVGAKQKIIMDVGLAAISILGVLTAVLLGSTLVHKEVDKKAIFMILTRPISRLEYLIGKYCGLVIAIVTMMAVMTGVMVVMILSGRGQLTPAVFAAVYGALLETVVMGAVVIFFSTFTTPILTMLFSLGIFVMGSLSNDLRIFAQRYGGEAMKLVTGVLYYLLPNLQVFNLRHEAVHDLHFRGIDLLNASLYAALYCSVILFFSYMIFRRREFL
ncbi:MAG: ABC transporter permease [bacterium]|nr:MAG: ABC transporter permease [bacterium]